MAQCPQEEARTKIFSLSELETVNMTSARKEKFPRSRHGGADPRKYVFLRFGGHNLGLREQVAALGEA